MTECPLLTADQVLAGQSAEAKEVRVEYIDKNDFSRKARMFRVMDDLKVCSLQLCYWYFPSDSPSTVVLLAIQGYYAFPLQAGVPRTAYHGIVSFMYKGQRVHLSPAPTWNGYM